MKYDLNSTEIRLSEEKKNQIEVKLKELLELCQLYKLPMFASVVILNNTENTEYTTIVYGAQSHRISLKEDKIRKHMLVANDFEVVPPRNISISEEC